MIRSIKAAMALVLALVTVAPADVGPDVAEKLYKQVTPSLVAVKFTWDNELGKRELTGSGVVVGADGLVMSTMAVFNQAIPDAQMTDFKIIIPNQAKDAEEIEAEFQGRDERTGVAFLRPKAKGDGKDAAKKSADADAEKDDDEKKAEADKPAKARVWTPLKFEEVAVRIGEPILSVGLLPEAASFKTYFMEGQASASLRGEVPMVLVQGGLAAIGSPVFNVEGKAIGFVGPQQGQNAFLNDGPNAMAAIINPPRFYVPTRDFRQSLEDPPVAGKPLALPWMGVPEMAGLKKDVAEVFGLVNQPAVQIAAVVADAPAAKAGLKQGDIVVKLNGEPLERGDEADELPGILRRKLLRMKSGSEVTLSVLRKPGEPAQDLKITLAEQPKRPNTAKRYFDEKLGFSVRELVFIDTYTRRLAADAKGVVVAVVRPQGAAETGKLQREDLITQLNGQPVGDLEQFQKDFEAARKAKPKEAVVLVVRREGREDTVRIEPPQ